MSRGLGLGVVASVAVVVVALASAFHLSGGSGNAARAVAAPRPPRPPRPALVVGDSMVAKAAAARTDNPLVKLVGYTGQAPPGLKPTDLEADYAAAGSPTTVVLNWNGNNPRRLPGMLLVETYREELTRDIRWYLSRGVTTIILAAAVPSAYNCLPWQTSWTTKAASVPGGMLGSVHVNDLYKQLTRKFPGKVFYTEKAARAIHPRMGCAATLNGQKCISDYIHPTPYCSAVYARALEALALGGPLT